ncbi:MAG: peptidase M13 [Gammaproteobacteria bacterium]|nr:peptidase M13 [Gammaproteobacteria bacterium]
MIKPFSVFVCCAVLVACANDAGTEKVRQQYLQDKTAPLRSGILLDNLDRSVNPGDDFSAYVNGTWMKSTEIPSDKSSYGVGVMVHERSQEDVRRIINDASSGNYEFGSDEQKVGDLYRSYMNWEAREARGLAPLRAEFATIDAVNDYDDLARYFAYGHKRGFGMPFGMFLYPDLKAPTRYAMYTWQGGIGLPDREYYFKDDEKSVEIRSKYLVHIEKMLELAGLPDAAESARTIMALESRIAASHMKKEQTRNIVGLYNPFNRSELRQLTPDFNWDAYLAAADLADHPRLIVAMTDYTRDFNDIFKSTDLATWKTYLKWTALNTAAGSLTRALDDQNFDFYRRTLSGAEEQLPMWRRAVSVVNGTVGEVVGKVYVKRHFPPQAKTHMQELVNNLLKAYEVSIKELDWMSAATKTEALDKLSKFTPKIGYPDIWKDYSALVIDAGDLYGNLQRSALVEYERDIKKLSGPVQKHEWAMTPQTVNAYYNPPQNEIVFPAAILQPPYFDLNAEDAVNYGAIGAVIGHEIGHGFDDQGSTFDGDGVLRNWWTEEDKAEFAKRTSALVAQYDEFKVFDDLTVNGEFTLGENIGDLGGLSIALKAYKMSLNGKPAPVLDGFTGEQRVFIGWAQSWLKKSREEALRQQVGTDPHSPAKFRVNGVVRNIPEFYTAFNVAPDSALYLPPKERVKIW